MTNDEVLQRSNGMRTLSSPSLVFVITDGKANNRAQALSQAQRLKTRENVQVASISIGDDLDAIVLTAIASDPIRDVYKIEELQDSTDRDIQLSEMFRRYCRMRIEAIYGKNIRAAVNQNGYKYYQLDTSNLVNQFTIELRFVKGRAEVVSSFSNELPKTSEHYVSESLNTGTDIYFIDRDPPPPPTTSEPEPEPDSKTQSKLNEPEPNVRVGLLVNEQEKSSSLSFRILSKLNEDGEEEEPIFIGNTFFYISKPASQANLLYFSVKGLENDNDYEIRIYNETVRNSAAKQFAQFSSFLSIIFICLSSFLINIMF